MAPNVAKQAIDDLTTKFFAAFANQSGAPVDLSPFRDLFVPTAVITRTCGNDFEVYDRISAVAWDDSRACLPLPNLGS